MDVSAITGQKNEVDTMKYIAKLQLNKQKYLAVLDEALVVVTLNENGKEIRWEIFKRDKSIDPINVNDIRKKLSMIG